MANPADIQALINAGWGVIPVRAGEKAAYHADWPTRTFAVSDFRPTDNVAVHTGLASGHRVDVDLDCLEAVIIAPTVFPRTLTSGHPGNPNSHYWFICPELETSSGYDDVAGGGKLCELRSNKHYTVVPPSVHPTGGPITWGGGPEPLTIGPQELKKLVGIVAICSLAARHWPEGNRHNAAAALAGYLARWTDISVEQAARMQTAICDAANDKEIADRVKAATDTVRKHQQGEKTTGGGALRTYFGAEIIEKMASWLGHDGDAVLDRMNEHHFVTRIGSTVVVGSEEPQGTLFQPTAEFAKWYMNQSVGKTPQGTWWLKHERRRQYPAVVFAPPPRPVPEGAYNLWRGFAVTPSDDPSGRYCARYINHIHDVICNGVTEHTEWVLDFMADIVQQPGKLVGKTLAVRGRMGTGKSLFVEHFGRLFGRHFIALSQREQITGKFNSHLSGKVVVFADEALWGGAKHDVGAFKRLITQTEMAVERKGIDIANEPNCVHLFIASNDKWIAPAGDQERRLVVLDVDRLHDAAYFDALWQECESPEFGPALLAYLSARTVDQKRLRKGIKTKGLVDQQSFSADPIQQWWEQVLMEGVVGTREEPWPAFISGHELYEQYTDDMGRGAGASHRGTRQYLLKRLRELMPEATLWTTRTSTVRNRESGHMITRPLHGAMLPSLVLCRKAYDRITGSTRPWPEAVDVATLPLDDNLKTMEEDL